MTKLYPLIGGHQQPLKGLLNHPKKVIENCNLPGGYVYYIFYIFIYFHLIRVVGISMNL